MGLILAIIITVVLSVYPTIAKPEKTISVAESPSGIVCVTKMKDAFEPGRSSLRRLVVSLTNEEGGKTQYIAGYAYKKFPNGKRMVMIMLEPKDIQGFTYLFWEQENRPAMWIYIPTIRRVRELKPLQASEFFLGTDFTYSDIGLVSLPKECELVEVTDYAGVKAYKVEEKVLGELRLFYSRIITWIAMDSFLPLQRDYYDDAGRLWKTELFRELTTIDKVPTPLLIEMKDLQTGYVTDLNITNVVYDVNIPDEIFDPKLLPKVVNLPLWQTYGSQTTKGK